MAAISVTYTFTNGTTADGANVSTNFTDIINGLSDGTKDISVSAITAAGACAFNGNVTLGNASGDDITFTGSLASAIPVKTNATYDFGSATLALGSVYLGNSTFTTRVKTAATSSYTFTLPVTGGTSGYELQTNGSGTTSWVQPMWTLLATGTASASASVDITSLTASGYAAWKVIISDVLIASANEVLCMRMSAGSGFISDAAAYWYTARVYGTDGGASGASSASATLMFLAGLGMKATGTKTCSMEIIIPNPSGTTNNKNIHFDGNYLLNSDIYVYAAGAGGLISTTAALDGLQFLSSSGNITAGTFKVYGIKS